MSCPCCKGALTRASHLPEIRGWLRPGDCYCAICEWVFPRELVHEAPARREACPKHGTVQGAGRTRG